MLTDSRIIHRHDRFEIVAQRHELMFRDGLALALHPVRHDGHDSLFHRAVVMPGGLRIVFDLRKLCPPLDRDLRTTQPRDVPGMVFYTLRQAYATAPEFLAVVCKSYAACWLPAEDRELLAEAA